ncbi:MAG: hypothetical protein CML66_12935 [Rhodobacteraceae bacterium]|nr:hypothetical protein [Paracoccaceae bacterium]MAY45696.1 hypothetical protein [Paracoccaceae bacterium]|tara:strand:- start:103 stop:369 length:267 start_codon:yes stop_codon:yes gene_type:complete
MTQQSTGGPTPPKVAGLATQSVDMARHHPVVIGVFGPENRMSAMVLMPNGKTEEVGVGQRIHGKQIVSIDKDGVILAHNGRAERLPLP